MIRLRDALVCGLLLSGGASTAAPPSAADVVALGESGSRSARAAQSGRKLTGRFLHITGGFVGFYWGARRGCAADGILQISTLTRSTRHTRVPKPRQRVTANEGLQVSTAQRHQAAILRFLSSMRRLDGSRTMSRTISTLSSGRATRRDTTTTKSMHARRSRS